MDGGARKWERGVEATRLESCCRGPGGGRAGRGGPGGGRVGRGGPGGGRVGAGGQVVREWVQGFKRQIRWRGTLVEGE